MKAIQTLMIAGAAALAVSASALAHHSFAAEFDSEAPIELSGIVTKVEWMNPHTFFYLDVEHEDGSYETWALELGSPNGLARRGWKRDSLQIGDEVNVSGFRARDGSLKGNARSVELANGEQLFSGENDAN